MLRSFLPLSLTLALISTPPAIAQTPQTQNPITQAITQAQAAKQQGQFDQAITLYKKALDLSVQTNDRIQQGLVHLAISQIYWGQQRFNDALPHALKAVELSQNTDGLTHGTALMSLGRIYDDATDYPKSLNAYQTALAHSEKTNGDRTLRASVQNNLGAVYLHLGEIQKSETLLSQALTTAQSQQQKFTNPLTLDTFNSACQVAKQDPTSMPDRLLGQFCGQLSAAALLPNINQARSQYFNLNRQLESSTRNNLGILRSNSGNYAAALKEQQQALIIDQALNPQGGATSLNNIGNLYISLGDYPKAIETFERSLALIRANANRPNLGQTLNNLALVYANQGNYRRAIALNEEALKILQQVNDRVNQAIAMDNLANHHQALGDYSKAQDYYNQALAIHQATGGKSGEANTLANLAVLADTKGDYNRGQTLHQQAISIFKAIGEKDKVAASLANQAREAEDQGQYPKALDLYNQALEIHRTIGNKNWQASTLGNLGGTYRALGQYGKSLEYYDQSLKIARDLGDRSMESVLLSGLAATHTERQEYDQAKPLLEQSLKLNRDIGSRRLEITTLRTLGRLYSRQQQFAPAIAQLTQAVDRAREAAVPPDETLALVDLSQAQVESGQYAPAQQSAQASAQLAAKLGDRPTLAKALTILGKAQLAQNQAANATQSLSQAAGVWESLRPGLSDSDKVSLFEIQTQTYRLWQKSLVAQNQPEVALEVSERGRARAFVELFATKLGDRPLSFPTLASIRAVAQQHRATLVQYAQVGDRELYIWVIKPTGQVTFHRSLLNSQSIQELVFDSRQSLNLRGRASINITTIGSTTMPQNPEGSRSLNSSTQLRRLHQILIEPIAADLPKNPEEAVVFLPQGSLFLLPFAALEDATGKALIDRHTISIAPAIQSLELTAQLKVLNSSGPSLIVGNPTMAQLPNLRLPPLPGSEAEAKAIAPLFSTTALIGDSAKKATVVAQMRSASLIHLATHGLLDTVRGDVPGAIALAPDRPGEDGLLTAGEIAQMKLKAQLVVLSACSTGRGDITGDGVIGLSRSLFLAGVPTVVVSLWDVSDVATAELMTAFHRNWFEKKLTKAQALRQAMLTTRQKYPDPALWSAFNLMGEGD